MASRVRRGTSLRSVGRQILRWRSAQAPRRGYACGVLSRKPRIQNHLGGFASKPDEKSGLNVEPVGEEQTRFPVLGRIR